MTGEYLCPRCGQPLSNDPEHPAGIDADGKIWPAMACLEHGWFGRREDGDVVPVEPAADDL